VEGDNRFDDLAGESSLREVLSRIADQPLDQIEEPLPVGLKWYLRLCTSSTQVSGRELPSVGVQVRPGIQE
jgi:hypothetical protein